MDYIKKARSFRAKKKLGQNFLVDKAVIDRIVAEINISKDETILEIGAGLGFVTAELAKYAKKIYAVEIDKDAIAELESLKLDNLEIIEKDILKLDLSSILTEPVKVVANIPYYITSPILLHLLGEIDDKDFSNRKYIKEAVLMVQYEVARRIAATEKSPSKDYGLLSILVNYWTEAEIISKVSAGSFYPSPKVDSALVKLNLRENPLVELKNPGLFRRVIQAAFGTRRKTLKNALVNGGFDSELVILALATAGIDPVRRAETVSIEEFKILSEIIGDYINKS